MVDHQIRAGITVYEFQDGVEINRRPAFPESIRILAIRRLKLIQSWRNIGKAARDAADSFIDHFGPASADAAAKFRELGERIAKVHP